MGGTLSASVFGRVRNGESKISNKGLCCPVGGFYTGITTLIAALLRAATHDVQCRSPGNMLKVSITIRTIP